MAWLDSLSELKEELAGVRAERLSQTSADEAEIQKERDELSRLAESLAVSDLLTEMNSTLLDGQGSVEKIVSWESDDEDDGDEEADLNEEDADDSATSAAVRHRGIACWIISLAPLVWPSALGCWSAKARTTPLPAGDRISLKGRESVPQTLRAN